MKSRQMEEVMRKLILLCVVLLSAGRYAAAQQSCEDPLKKAIAEADIIAAADIARVAPSPGSWSIHYFMSIQYVDYTGPEVLKGALSNRKFSAGYFLWEGGRLSDKKEPRLSPDLFRAGVRQLVFIRKAKEGAYRYGTLHPYPAPLTFMPTEVLFVLRADPATLEKVKEAVSQNKKADFANG